MKFPAMSFEARMNKVFAGLSMPFLRLKSFWHEQRLAFVVGLSRERFSHARFWVNGREQFLRAKDLEEFINYTRHLCKQHELRCPDNFLLTQMWCSGKTVKFQSRECKIEILTYWHF